MLISKAYAADNFGAKIFGGSDWVSFLPLILIFAVFYLLLIRPQQRRMQEHRKLVAGLKRGDKVITGGGLIATVTKVTEDDEVQLEIAEGVRVRALRSSIASVLNQTETPVKAVSETEKSK